MSGFRSEALVGVLASNLDAADEARPVVAILLESKSESKKVGR
jgi:hypothetical protein